MEGFKPIERTEETISYLGVELPKASDVSGAVSSEKYRDFIEDEFTLELQKKVAVCFKNGDPILVEGGTSIGKTTAIRKMCAELGYEVHYVNLNGATDVEDLMGRYVPNAHREKLGDSEYIFADGKVTSGLRQEEGKIKVIVLDEFNSASPNIVIRLHEVLDALERGGQVTLSEDASEILDVDKTKTHIVGLMNPPGGEFIQREPLDPAQLRRWVYQKEADTLPKNVLGGRTQSLFGLKREDDTSVPETMFLPSRKDTLSLESLATIPGLEMILAKYDEFHEQAKNLVRTRKVAKDQPQSFTFDDNEERRRVRDFILNFYQGDITKTMQDALRYYYSGKILDSTDKAKLEELIRLVEHTEQTADPRRKDPKTIASQPSVQFTTPKTPRSAEQSIDLVSAEKILGENFFGPEAIKKTFGFEVKKVPEIPFSQEEIERAKELGQQLVLYVDNTPDGKPLSIMGINGILESKTSEGSKLLYDTDWYKDEAFANEAPTVGWKLTSKEIIPNSTSKNYLEQTVVLIEYLRKEVFRGVTLKDIPKEYLDAVEEFEDKKTTIEGLISSDWKKAAEELANLKITGLTRETPTEIMYRLALTEKTTKSRPLESTYSWSALRESDGGLVNLGLFDSGGTYVSRGDPDITDSSLGVCFSRR
jgi:MoxR-like ATPase